LIERIFSTSYRASNSCSGSPKYSTEYRYNTQYDR
jgi:hypothetical protein